MVHYASVVVRRSLRSRGVRSRWVARPSSARRSRHDRHRLPWPCFAGAVRSSWCDARDRIVDHRSRLPRWVRLGFPCRQGRRRVTKSRLGTGPGGASKPGVLVGRRRQPPHPPFGHPLPDGAREIPRHGEAGFSSPQRGAVPAKARQAGSRRRAPATQHSIGFRGTRPSSRCPRTTKYKPRAAMRSSAQRYRRLSAVESRPSVSMSARPLGKEVKPQNPVCRRSGVPA